METVRGVLYIVRSSLLCIAFNYSHTRWSIPRPNEVKFVAKKKNTKCSQQRIACKRYSLSEFLIKLLRNKTFPIR